MRTYSAAERCMLLLFSPAGGEKPLSMGDFRRMEQTLLALGTGGFSEGDQVTEEVLERLGLAPEKREILLRRLSQEDVLMRQLRQLEKLGIVPVTRISPEYPRRILETLGTRSPALLYCAGNLSLFRQACVSLVGSRRLRQGGVEFAKALGRAAARQGLVYVSGGAAGADTMGLEGVMEQGGTAILFLPDSLLYRMRGMERWLQEGRLLLVSEYGYAMNFSTQRAYSRNRLIHAMGEKTFVAQSDYGQGGTWNGVLENLKNGWSPVYMCTLEPEDPGTKGLLERGCHGVRLEDLGDIRALREAQTGLF